MNYSSQSLARTLKDTGCQVFLNTLDKVDGIKDLVLSKTILTRLDSICGMQKLRQNAVDKVFKLETSPPVFSETTNRVYIIHPTLDETRQVVDQIDGYLNQADDNSTAPDNVKFWIIFLPKLVHYCNLFLEEEGVYEYVSLLECPLGLTPLEYDLYSLENEASFKSLYLSKDITPLDEIFHSLLQLRIITGDSMKIHSQGKYATILAEKLTNFNNDNDINFTNNNQQSSFTDLYLFDRDSDYASVLLSQLNYEGILDEEFGIFANKLEFESSNSSNPVNVKHSLAGESDPIYRDIRDNHFSTVFSLLKTKNHEMKEKYTRSQAMDLSNLKDFVANELRGLQAEFKSLSIHISACEEIMRERNKYDFSDQLRVEQNLIDGVDVRKSLDYITKMISHQLNPHVPLRLLSILSLILGGLPPKDYKKYHSLYCENYGLFHNVTFNNLKKLGLLSEMNLSLTGGGGFGDKFISAVVSSSVLPKRGNLSQMLKKYQLVPEIGATGYNIRDPKDPAFVFGGSYIPLICQLIDNILTPNQKKATSTIAQQRDRSILVYFVGGVTFAEMTALRYIAKTKNIQIGVATTSIINGNRLMQYLFPPEINR